MNIDPLAIVGSVVVTIFNVVTLLLLTPYFAVAFPGMKSALFRLTRRSNREDFVFVVNRAVDLTSNYIVGNLAISLMAAATSFVAFLLLGLPYPLALATWVGIMDLIPAIGALIGMIPVIAVASQLVGGSLAGLVGALLALPVAALIKVLLTRVLRPRPDGNGSPGTRRTGIPATHPRAAR